MDREKTINSLKKKEKRKGKYVGWNDRKGGTV